MSSRRSLPRPLFASAYAVGSILVILPLLQVVLLIWPPRPSELTWRFGAAGVIGNALLLPLLGTALVIYAASLLEHRRFLRMVASSSLLLSLGLLALLTLFSLDAMQLRASVNPAVTAQYDTSSANAAVSFLLTTLTWGWLGIGGLVASRKPKGMSDRSPAITTPVVVGRGQLQQEKGEVTA